MRVVLNIIGKLVGIAILLGIALPLVLVGGAFFGLLLGSIGMICGICAAVVVTIIACIICARFGDLAFNWIGTVEKLKTNFGGKAK